MMRAIAYRIQENAFGGLPTAVEWRLAKPEGEFESEGPYRRAAADEGEARCAPRQGVA
jgi:hypothetical protein